MFGKFERYVACGTVVWLSIVADTCVYVDLKLVVVSAVVTKNIKRHINTIV